MKNEKGFNKRFDLAIERMSKDILIEVMQCNLKREKIMKKNKWNFKEI